MDIHTFITRYREAFGEQAPLPLLFFYSDTPLAETEKTNGCFFKRLDDVRKGMPASLNAENITCGGGKLYTGFAPMHERIPGFVSLKEKYKQTPEQVTDYIHRLDIRPATGAYLNFVRIDQAKSLAQMEGLLFYATPDMLSGLFAWAAFDNNSPDAVATPFGSGCSVVVSSAVQENRRNGNRTFLGLFDPSVRPYVGANELGFVIPACRFKSMYETLPSCCLSGTPAWNKVKARLQAE